MHEYELMPRAWSCFQVRCSPDLGQVAPEVTRPENANSCLAEQV